MSEVSIHSPLNSMPILEHVNGAEIQRHINDKVRNSRLHFFAKLVQTVLLYPITTTVTLSFRVLKLLTWVPVKTGFYKISGHHTEASNFSEREYLKTVKAFRDILFIPSVAARAFQDMISSRVDFVDDIEPMPTQDYLSVHYTKEFQQFSSYMHGCGTFEVTRPEGITEFPAASDGSLNTIMASHLFKPGMMAINFGSPNVATFVTKADDDGSVQTVKVDAKSLYREEMSYHPTNGKIQSGLFLVPTNLPEEALERFKQAAEKMQGRKDITCVNTNCRVLQEAGFSIEGVAMDGVVFPNTLMEHLLFRNVIYTDSNGTKHKVHFDIINTTKHNLEEFCEEIDTAVVGTRLRHIRRNADTEENQKARGIAAQALIAEEADRLAQIDLDQNVDDEYLGKRKVTVSVPSVLGDAIAGIWGRHTMYEVDLSDKRKEISKAFEDFAAQNNEDNTPKLRPFPQEKPSLGTRLKRDLFFSGPMIRFLRRHMMGRVDEIHLHTQDLFKHLKSTEGAHLNYVLLDDKIVLARVKANDESDETHRKISDWALSKHALLAGREEVYCSGEIWYDKAKNRFMMNHDSGTYKPSQERVEVVAELANEIFDAHNFDNIFEAVPINEESAAVA